VSGTTRSRPIWRSPTRNRPPDRGSGTGEPGHGPSGRLGTLLPGRDARRRSVRARRQECRRLPATGIIRRYRWQVGKSRRSRARPDNLRSFCRAAVSAEALSAPRRAPARRLSTVASRRICGLQSGELFGSLPDIPSTLLGQGGRAGLRLPRLVKAPVAAPRARAVLPAAAPRRWLKGRPFNSGRSVRAATRPSCCDARGSSGSRDARHSRGMGRRNPGAG